MTSSVTVRRARPSDASAIGCLGALLVAEHHDFDPKRFLAPRRDMPEAYGRFLESQMQQPDKIVLVAELDGMIAGYVYAGNEGNDYMVLRGPAGEIYDLVVDPAHRRHGVGRHGSNAHRRRRGNANRGALRTDTSGTQWPLAGRGSDRLACRGVPMPSPAALPIGAYVSARHTG